MSLRTITEQMVAAAHRHSQSQRSQQCVTGFLGRDWMSDKEELMEGVKDDRGVKVVEYQPLRKSTRPTPTEHGAVVNSIVAIAESYVVPSEDREQEVGLQFWFQTISVAKSLLMQLICHLEVAEGTARTKTPVGRYAFMLLAHNKVSRQKPLRPCTNSKGRRLRGMATDGERD
ncbi:hypothetical protein EVAR_96691_1 [Eumeta japonica]|uniref:Uncharacterized protein n=1 Tax=Eumeta variegata TaxID=151549 RepID=A0A4C1WK19_EUMVA|nr:hypothetical protein EVAR_96691_1 [Eumeta japonica]